MLLTTACNRPEETTEEPIQYWTEDSPAMLSIIDFVNSVCDESSDSYVEPSERIAVFDSDGTLYGELFPSYFDKCLMMHRLLRDKTYKPNPDDRKYAKELEKALLSGQPEPDSTRSDSQITAESFKGFTVEEYRKYIREFMNEPAVGFEGMTYGKGAYKPMLALIKYLVRHEFMVYIISGTETNLLRELWADDLGTWVPPCRIIGSTMTLAATGQGDKALRDYNLSSDDEVIIAGSMTNKCNKMAKVSTIVNQIGIPPLLAFGNSSGDFSMGTYTVRNGGKAYMLLCDDTERDYGNTEKAAKFEKQCKELGFETVSMKNEFETIYGEKVKKTSYIQEQEQQQLAPAA